MGKIERSWTLVKASWGVLRADKELIVFPVISAFVLLIVTATFVVPMFLAGIFERGGEGIPVLGVIFGFAFYVVQYTVIFYCNSALVGAALIRLEGGDPTLADGFRIANQRFGSIVGYALVAATVGVILRQISRRGMVGRIIASVFGLAWNLATFLAVPVLVVEGIGPIEAVKRSTQLLKKTWGEQIVGNIGIGAAFGLMSLASMAVFGTALVGAIGTKSIPLIAAAAVVLVLVMVMLGLVGSTLSAIYTAAVYRYATSGDAGTFFDASLVRDAFRPQ
ncbi:MAG TPA: DUF6159 family protein [Candidatus Polarisedimenticolaceae bacterium]|nr:DUF6159 family protein [Candidatus Polarisedimenticolaceae bacterium]